MQAQPPPAAMLVSLGPATVIASIRVNSSAAVPPNTLAVHDIRPAVGPKKVPVRIAPTNAGPNTLPTPSRYVL